MLGPANPFKTLARHARPTATVRTRCCRTTRSWRSTRRCSTSATSGFTVPFTFAIAALITGRFGEGWLTDTRRTTLVAWGFLSVGDHPRRVVELRGARLGRLLGVGPGRERVVAAVAHRDRVHPLGDRAGAPRDAAGLEPVARRSRRSASRSSARSSRGRACINSVHSVHGVRHRPVAARLPRGRAPSAASGSSRGAATSCARPAASTSRCRARSAFLVNNLLFAGLAVVVLLGTVYPLLAEALQGRQLSVGEPYFDRMTTPIGIALLFLMAVAPALPWRATSGDVLRRPAARPGVVRRRHDGGRGGARRADRVDAASPSGSPPSRWPAIVRQFAVGIRPSRAGGRVGGTRRLRDGAAATRVCTAGSSCTRHRAASRSRSRRRARTRPRHEVRLAQGRVGDGRRLPVTYLGRTVSNADQKHA